MLPEFDLLMPRTLGEALDMLAERAPELKPVAGGTNVIVEMRDGSHSYRTLMDVSRLEELQGIRRDDGQIVIGGGTTIADILTNPLIAAYAPPLKQAAAVLGSPLVRNRATVAGNLVDASPAADMAPPLLILDAELELVSRDATRRISLGEFFIGPNKSLIQPGELLVMIRFPAMRSQSVGAFHKIGLRKAQACSVISAAVRIDGDASGACHQARIALGAVAPRPIRVHEAEDLLCGRSLTPENIASASELSADATRPIDDVRAAAAYRRRVVEVLVRRLLAESAEAFREAGKLN